MESARHRVSAVRTWGDDPEAWQVLVATDDLAIAVYNGKHTNNFFQFAIDKKEQ